MAKDRPNGKEVRQSFTPWCQDADSVIAHFDTSVENGLTALEAGRRTAEYGPNELEKEPSTPLWKLVVEQFDDALVKILLLAAVVSFVLALLEDNPDESGMRAFVEPCVILLILILNAIVGVWQEANAESALEALKNMQPEIARCLRDGELDELPARELVPGDIIHVGAGDKVPADCRLLKINTATLRAEQSSLTGSVLLIDHRMVPRTTAKWACMRL
jgi:P-type Ca2+ transporter type 2C